MTNTSRPAIPASGNQLNGLDHLRALAIILVFLFHYGIFDHPQWIQTIGSFGWTGVDLFFVLSGYLIAGQLFKNQSAGKPFSVIRFYIKRFFRIIPAYLVVLSLYFLLPAFREKEALPPLWKFLTFTQNIGLDAQNEGTFSHAWSLCIEEQFYFILPLLLVFLVSVKLYKRSGVLFILLFLLGIAARYYSYQTYIAPYANQDLFWLNWSKYIYYPTPARLDGLLVGVSIAAMQVYKPSWKQWIDTHKLVVAATLAAILCAALLLNSDRTTLIASLLAFPLVAFLYGCLLLFAVNPSTIVYRVYSPVTRTIAQLSYALYLSHKGVIHLTQEWLSNWGIDREGSLMFVCCAVTCMITAFVLHLLVEKPFMRLRDQLLRRNLPVKAIS